MNISKKLLASTVGLVALSVCAIDRPAEAYTQFFGEDLGQPGEPRLPAHPNADTARFNFFSNLVGVGTENFESFSNGTPAPITVNFGSDTATLTGQGAIRSVPSGTNGFGRYPISGNNFYEVSGIFNLAFSTPQAAFGFYGVDIGDFGGRVTLSLTKSGGGTELVTVPNTINGNGGGVLYFGLIASNPGETFTGISFGNTAPGVDFFAFDDFSIGRLEQVKPAPVPGVFAGVLLAAGVFGGAEIKRRKAQVKQAQA